MDKIRNFLEVIKNLKKKNVSQNKSDAALENIKEEKRDSIDNKTDEPPTSTVNRRFLKKALIICLAFVAAAYFGSSLISGDNKQDTRVEVATGRDNEITKEMSEDYVSLAKKEQEKRSHLNIDSEKTAASDTAKNNDAQSRTIKTETAPAETTPKTASALPAVNPYMAGVYNPYMNAQMQLQKQQQQTAKKDERDDKKIKEKETYSSSITFINSEKDAASDTGDKTQNAAGGIMTYTAPMQANSIAAQKEARHHDIYRA